MLYAIEQSFDSFDEFDAFPTGWDTRFQLNGSLSCRARLGHSRGEGVLINTATLTSGTLQEGSTPRDMRTFAIPLSLGGNLAWLGKDADENSLLQFSDSRELFAIAAGSCSICTISIDSVIVDDMLARRGTDAEAVFASEAVLSLAPDERASLVRDVSLLSEFLAKYGRHDVMPELSFGLQEALLGSLVDHLELGSQDRQRLPAHAAAQLVRSAIGFMHESGADSVVEIGEALGVSRRSLELGFQKYVGVPPKRYLKTLRLHRCRAELLEQHASETSVGEIARRHGFWHMGQFGRDYRGLFGERPSDTLGRQR